MNKNALPLAPQPIKRSRREEAMAHYEQLWKHNPEMFNPERNARERERIERSWNFLHQHIVLKDLMAVDLGSGKGLFSRRIASQGGRIEAVDISSVALNNLSDTTIPCHQDYLPSSRLADDTYDLVIALDLLAELPPSEHRLFFSELHRIAKKKGWLLFSTPIDFTTEHPLEKLLDLVQTDWEMVDSKYSYNSIFLNFCDFLGAPKRWVRGWKETDFYREEKEKRRGLARWWWELNSHLPLAGFWWCIAHIFSPFLNWIKQSRKTLLFLEKITKNFFHLRGISHIILLAKPRTILPSIEEEEIPRYRKTKRQVWE